MVFDFFNAWQWKWSEVCIQPNFNVLSNVANALGNIANAFKNNYSMLENISNALKNIVTHFQCILDLSPYVYLWLMMGFRK